MARSSLALTLSSALLLSWTAPLAAQPTDDPVRFQYAAPPECPNAAAFAARVHERTPRGRLADPEELARTFSIKLAADARGFSGEVEFLDDGGATVSRRLHGEQCDAVVTSLALVTALALDASLRPEDPPAPAVVAPPAVEPTLLAAATQPPPPRARRPAPQRALSGARVGFGGGYESAIGGPQLGLLGQLDWHGGFALRLSGHYGWAEHTDVLARRAELRVLGLETSVCPWRFRADQLAFAPCALVDLGSLRARGVTSEKLTSPGSDTKVWAAVGAELRLTWEVAAPFWVELRGAAAFPLQASHRFVFDNPTRVVYRVPYFFGIGRRAATQVRAVR